MDMNLEKVFDKINELKDELKKKSRKRYICYECNVKLPFGGNIIDVSFLDGESYMICPECGDMILLKELREDLAGKINELKEELEKESKKGYICCECSAAFPLDGNIDVSFWAGENFVICPECGDIVLLEELKEDLLNANNYLPMSRFIATEDWEEEHEKKTKRGIVKTLLERVKGKDIKTKIKAIRDLRALGDKSAIPPLILTLILQNSKKFKVQNEKIEVRVCILVTLKKLMGNYDFDQFCIFWEGKEMDALPDLVGWTEEDDARIKEKFSGWFKDTWRYERDGWFDNKSI